MSVPPVLYIASFGYHHRTPPSANAVWLINHTYVAGWFKTLLIILGPQLDIAERKDSGAVSWVFGCTDGHDRSVAVAEYTAATVRRTGLTVYVDHLDIYHQNDDEPGQRRRP
jgi:UPF0042 nucleotide-binding protein